MENDNPYTESGEKWRRRTAPFRIRLRTHKSSGTVQVAIKTPRGIQWVSTGQTSMLAAGKVVDLAMLQRLQTAACAEILTADAISRMLTGRKFTVSDIYDAWEKDHETELAATTISGYSATLKQWIAERELERSTLMEINVLSLRAWVNSKNVPMGTRKGRLSALRSFFRFASAAGYCVGDPSRRVTVQSRDLLFRQIEKRAILPITEEEFRRLMAPWANISRQWRHAVALAYWLAFRICDVACLEWDSVKENEIVIYPRKTGRRLALPLDSELLGGGELRTVLAEMREDRLASSSPFCFPWMREALLDTKKRAKLSVYFGRVLERNGIRGKSFHSLRHSAAMRLKGAGKTLEEIGKVLGHASEGATAVYTAHEPPDQLAPGQTKISG